MILFLSYEQFHIDITTFFLIIRKRWKIFKKMYHNIIKNLIKITYQRTIISSRNIQHTNITLIIGTIIRIMARSRAYASRITIAILNSFSYPLITK